MVSRIIQVFRLMTVTFNLYFSTKLKSNKVWMKYPLYGHCFWNTFDTKLKSNKVGIKCPLYLYAHCFWNTFADLGGMVKPILRCGEWILVSFRIQWSMIVLTIFLSWWTKLTWLINKRKLSKRSYSFQFQCKLRSSSLVQ